MLSTVIPTVIIAISAYISFLLLGFYGITLTAVSVIYNLPLLISSSINQNIIDNILGLSIHSKNDYDATNRI
jgi:Na+/H+-translocating membrane pyrophosphatase